MHVPYYSVTVQTNPQPQQKGEVLRGGFRGAAAGAVIGACLSERGYSVNRAVRICATSRTGFVNPSGNVSVTPNTLKKCNYSVDAVCVIE